MYGYIYKTTNLINGKIYIGQKKSNKFLHESYLGSGNYIKAAINKYGRDNFSVEIIDTAQTKEELNQKEIFYIKKYNSTDMAVGYNIHSGGRGGILTGDAESWSNARKGPLNGRYGAEVSTETRNKIGEANSKYTRTEEVKKRISNSLKGRPKPEGFGAKVSAAQKGRVKSELELEHLRIGNLKAAEKNRGKHIYNNGEHEIRLHDSDTIPEGFVRGRLPKISEVMSMQDHSGVHNAMYGKKHSEESRLKMSEAKKRNAAARKLASN